MRGPALPAGRFLFWGILTIVARLSHCQECESRPP